MLVRRKRSLLHRTVSESPPAIGDSLRCTTNETSEVRTGAAKVSVKAVTNWWEYPLGDYEQFTRNMVSLLASTDATRGNIQVIKTTIADVDKEIQVMQLESESIEAFLAETPTEIGSECVRNQLLRAPTWRCG